MFSKFLFSLVALFLIAEAPHASATTIGTTGSGNASAAFFGSYATPSFGESLLSPGGVLSSVTFYSTNVILGSNVRLVIAPIVGNDPGKALYSSQYSLSDGDNTFSNLGVSTTAGSEYIVYLTTLGVTSNAVKYATFGANTRNTYSGGEFLYGDLDCDGVQQFNTSSIRDLAFSATFAPAAAVTPEPSSLMLMATGLLSAGTMLRRRRSVTA